SRPPTGRGSRATSSRSRSASSSRRPSLPALRLFCFMYRTLLLLALLVAAGGMEARAQATLSAARVAELVPTPGILRNGVSNLHAEGDSLWVGPFLNLTTAGGQTWRVPDADSLAGSRNRVFSLDAEGPVVW